jgi:signal transduction histidine kinase/CheY-like chemotaxis protein
MAGAPSTADMTIFCYCTALLLLFYVSWAWEKSGSIQTYSFIVLVVVFIGILCVGCEYGKATLAHERNQIQGLMPPDAVTRVIAILAVSEMKQMALTYILIMFCSVIACPVKFFLSAAVNMFGFLLFASYCFYSTTILQVFSEIPSQQLCEYAHTLTMAIVFLGVLTHLQWNVESAAREKFAAFGQVGKLDKALLIAESQKLQEKAEAKARAEANLSAWICHEIRNPFCAITGLAELLQQGCSEDEQQDGGSPRDPDDEQLQRWQQQKLHHRKLASQILTSSSYICRVLNNMLDLSKIDAGRMVLKNEIIDLNALVSDLTSILSPMCKPNVELQSCIHFVGSEGKDSRAGEEGRGLQIMGDYQRWMQLLINITSNALKFTDYGFVRIAIEVNANKKLEVKVMDTGRGIAESETCRVFKKYEQVNTTSGGSGLGLVIAQKIAGLWGTSIKIRSPWQAGTSSTGTMFYLRMKYTPAPVGAAGMATSPVTTAPESLARRTKKLGGLYGARMLLVEDDELNALLMGTRLRVSSELVRYGLVVEQCRSADEAVELLRSDLDAFDIIIMDEHFNDVSDSPADRMRGSSEPILRGSDAIQVLRRLGCEAFIISCSGNCLEKDFAGYKNAGADECWPKPYPNASRIEADLLQWLGDSTVPRSPQRRRE